MTTATVIYLFDLQEYNLW